MNGAQQSSYSSSCRAERPSLPSVRDILHAENSADLDFPSQSRHRYSASVSRPDSAWPDSLRRSPYPQPMHEGAGHSRDARNLPTLKTPANGPGNTLHPVSTPLSSYSSAPSLPGSAVQRSSFSSPNHYQPTALQPPTATDSRSRPFSSHSELPRPPSPIVRPSKQGDVNQPQAPTTSVARYLGQENIPGKGVCHVYEDGSMCKANIGGEPVNPAWGVTKAGKPRKRLAQACTTCREKKIKCEPGFPRCAQCTKMDRECKRSDADHNRPDPDSSLESHRGSHSRAGDPSRLAPVGEKGVVRKREPSPEQLGAIPPLNAAGVPPHLSNGTGLGHDSKRHRHQHTELSQASHEQGPSSRRPSNQSFTHDMPIDFAWGVDPYTVDPDLTLELLNLYFVYRDYGCYKLFPQKEFMSWVEHNKQKSDDDRMLLYMMMAVGSMFSEDQSHKFQGNTFANIARLAQQEAFGKFSLQLAHTRFFLMFYNFAKQKMADAWEFAGGACRVLSALRFNVDEGIEDIPENCTEFAYGLNRVQIEDCRRRTYWIGYTIDRYISFCSDQVGALCDADTFVRLPLPEANFDAGVDTPTDFFNGGLPERIGEEYGSVASVAMAASIWGEVVATTYRLTHRKTNNYAAYLEDFYTHSNARLDDLEKSLPSDLKYSKANTENCVKNGRCAEYFVIHALHKVAGIALNRLGSYDLLPRDRAVRNIRQANIYARQLLAIASCMGRVSPEKRSADVNSALLQPFPGYAVQIACDVVSRGGGDMKDLTCALKLLSDAGFVLDSIGRVWREAQTQGERINDRLIEMTSRAIDDKSNPNSKPWALPQPMQGSFLRKQHDLVHNTPADIYIEAVRGLASPETPTAR